MLHQADRDRILLHQRYFRAFLSADEIATRVDEMGAELNLMQAGGRVCFVIMLKGAFVFAADLLRASALQGEVCFVRTSSYSGTSTEGKVKLLLPPEEALIRDREVIVVEDIIDSGYTMQAFLPALVAMKPRSVKLVSLLHKPDARRVDVAIDLIGFSIPDKFVVGYGLDYDGLGRNLPAIYQLEEIV